MLVKIVLFILAVILYSGIAMLMLNEMYINDKPDKIGIIVGIWINILLDKIN